jgi:hypothetical protein
MSDNYVGFLSVEDLIRLKVLAEERAIQFRRWESENMEDGRDDDASAAANTAAIYEALHERVKQAIEDAKPVE